MIREPAVAGQFYPGLPEPLKKSIEQLTKKHSARTAAFGIISPHAGFMYSGPVAGMLFSQIKLPDTCIIMGPNHTGYGRPFSIMAEGSWKIPFGKIDIDEELAKNLLKRSRLIQNDPTAHAFEHSIEVQLPFIYFFKKEFKFVPIILSHADLKTYREIGRNIAETIKDAKKEVLLIASSDMTHYEPEKTARAKDTEAIKTILKLDEEALIEKIKELDISMCGYAPTAVMLTASKILGAKKARLINYRTSGDASGSRSSVVGYAGIIISG